MKLFTTFAPRKVSWELTYIQTNGKSPTGLWLNNQSLIRESLQKLKKAGISGIRLVVFPDEITRNGKNFDWKPVDIMLKFCASEHLEVQLCIGPFQYPHYPGIYLPHDLLEYVFNSPRSLDTTPIIREYGREFLEKQMEKYGRDKRIAGFHLANEWPDRQRVAHRESFKTWVSEDFMVKAAEFLKKHTEKPIFLNTNIDAADKYKLVHTFKLLIDALGGQMNLGFDIYPSQETWKNVPLQKLRRLIRPYHKSYKWVDAYLTTCTLYFAEVEAQPWGNGSAWQRIIQNSSDPHMQILQYSRNSLPVTWQKHIASSGCEIVSLWGSDFWLAASEMGINWPLSQIATLKEL